MGEPGEDDWEIDDDLTIGRFDDWAIWRFDDWAIIAV
jgi:hypothetical protein